MACLDAGPHSYFLVGLSDDGYWEIWVCKYCAHKQWKKNYKW